VEEEGFLQVLLSFDVSKHSFLLRKAAEVAGGVVDLPLNLANGLLQAGFGSSEVVADEIAQRRDVRVELPDGRVSAGRLLGRPVAGDDQLIVLADDGIQP